MRNDRRTPGVTAIVALILGLGLPASNAAAQSVIPTQWIAKQYTEILGRAPTPSEWLFWDAYFDTNGCSATTLKTMGTALLTGIEFPTRYGDTTSFERGARVVALVRSVFNHEPSPTDWTTYYAPYVATTKTWSQTIDAAYASGWFTGVHAPAACNASTPAYGWNVQAALDLKNATGNGTSRSAADLQEDLDDAASTCGTVELDPGELVQISQPLDIPPCVTLTTDGAPGPTAYAKMGRIIGTNWLCLWTSSGVAVRLGEGARLENVWVDTRHVYECRLASVEVSGSSTADPSVVSDNVISNPAPGGVGIKLRGLATTGEACEDASVSGNLITGYQRTHTRDRMTRAQSADGILVFCEDATVEDNEIVDVGDWGIGLFGVVERASPFTSSVSEVQQSVVRNNVVLSAGTSGTVAIGADPAGECLPPFGGPPVTCNDLPVERSFSGASVEDNLFWTGSRTTFDVGLLIGGNTYWGINGPFGRGASFTGNTTGDGTSARVNVGIAVNGMYDTTLDANTGDTGADGSFVLVDSIGDASGDSDGCPTIAVGDTAPWVASFTSGSQASVGEAGLWGCLLPPKITDGTTDGLDKIVTDGEHFEGLASGLQFNMWAANYRPPTHFFEDEWDTEPEFAALLVDLLELKQDGVNVVRIPLHTRGIMTSATTFDTDNLDMLDRFIDAAGKIGIRVAIMGLASFDPDEEPSWYTSVNEADRWAIQAAFWDKIADRLADRPEVAYYELINEPAVIRDPAPTPPYDVEDWCNEAEVFGLCFNPYLTVDLDGREHWEVVEEWTTAMVNAIREHDALTPITIGSLAFPSGPGGPAIVGPILDFMNVHYYPEDDSATVDNEVETVALTRVKNMQYSGKPLVIGEFFYNFLPSTPTSGCNDLCLATFVAGSLPEVTGWFGFLGGPTIPTTIEMQRNPSSYVLLLGWAHLFKYFTPAISPCYDCQPY